MEKMVGKVKKIIGKVNVKFNLFNRLSGEYKECVGETRFCRVVYPSVLIKQVINVDPSDTKSLND